MKIGTCVRGGNILEDLENGIWFGEHYCEHCFPGRGDTDWKEIIDILQRGNYRGDITVEGYHDSAYCGAREQEGQRQALAYLRGCMDEPVMDELA
ncbi:MAG: hypothetical protein NC337_02825 [Roseburia sp.]|nr:hypothetical protein [Roseburia sp.]